jgi:uncharacterized membrane protein
MENIGNHQISNQTSTVVWSQPTTDEQKKYYSKHAPKRKVYGWIMTVLQTAHGFLAFAAWMAVFLWVFKSIPDYQFFAPILAVGSLFALHVLFRTTWTTYWYDKLDDDPNTDSSFMIPVAIFLLLLISEFNGARMFLAGQVKPIEKVDAMPIEQDHATTIASIQQSYMNDKAEINELYKQKEKAAVAPIDRQIRIAEQNDQKAGNLRSKRSAVVAAIQADKVAALEAAYQRFEKSKQGQIQRKESAVAVVDNQNAAEVARHIDEMGSTSTYAWVLSLALLTLIAALGYARVRINVKSGILPLRNYTVLDAHGSAVERLGTALSDSANRQSLKFAVWLHRMLSPKDPITSFDGTVVSKPGTYNTPLGFFPPTLPDPAEEDEKLRQKVAKKVMEEASKGKVVLTPELLETELTKAKTMNGSYMASQLGKREPSPTPAASGEGMALTADALEYWKSRLNTQLRAFDIAATPVERDTIQRYVFYDPMSPIVKEGNRMNLEWGVKDGLFQVRLKTREHFVPLGKLTIDALLYQDPADNEQAADEEDVLFKQNSDLFKQTIQPQYDADGRVIGIKYQKRIGEWETIPYASVKARYNIYLKRAEKKPSDATKAGLDAWDYAMHLFEDGRKELRSNMVPIHDEE